MNLSEKNLNLAVDFFMGKEESLDAMGDDFKNLFLTYATDNNSSSLRELATIEYLGYTSFNQKLGADGIDEKTGRLKEVKPKMLTVKKPKLSGPSGNFNDMTFELLEKKKDFDVICSLFTKESKFVYIVEFPLTNIYEKLQKPFINAKLGRRVVCPFSFFDYNTDDLIVHYMNDKLLDSSVQKEHAKMLRKIYERQN